MQRYAYFLDSNLAINTKKRILKRFDNLSQELKLSIDRGLFTSNLGPSFDLFHLNSITSIGMFFQNIGNLIELGFGSIFLIGTKVLIITAVLFLKLNEILSI